MGSRSVTRLGLRSGEEESFRRSSWERRLRILPTIGYLCLHLLSSFHPCLPSAGKEWLLGVRCKANFPHCCVPPPSSSWLASCCFFRSSFSFSFTGSGTGMSSGAFRLLRLASLRAGSWHRVGGRLEARASSWPLSPYSLAPCSASVPLKMHPTQKSSWGNSSQVGSLSVKAVEIGEVGGRGVCQNQMSFLGSKAGLTLFSKEGLSSGN